MVPKPRKLATGPNACLDESSESEHPLSALLAAAMVFAVYVVPALVGGDYSRGDFEMTGARVGAALLLAGLLDLGLRLAPRRRNGHWLPAALLLLVAAGITNFGLAVAAAWVHVPPFGVLLVAFAVAAAPTFLLPFIERKPTLVLGCAAASTALTTFWMAIFHPYL